jgi:MerR family transcriptional regulator/heat shock protein HspR
MSNPKNSPKPGDRGLGSSGLGDSRLGDSRLGGARLGSVSAGPDPDAAHFAISVAAELAGMHAQTLRTYDRLGLVIPHRTSGGGRRYSQRDVDLLREVQRLSQDEGVNLAGIKRIIELTNQVEALQARVSELLAEVAALRPTYGRELVPVPRSNALVVWQRRKS